MSNKLKQPLPVDETPTAHEILYANPEVVGFLTREVVHFHTLIGRILKRLDKLEGRE